MTVELLSSPHHEKVEAQPLRAGQTHELSSGFSIAQFPLMQAA